MGSRAIRKFSIQERFEIISNLDSSFLRRRCMFFLWVIINNNATQTENMSRALGIPGFSNKETMGKEIPAVMEESDT